MGKLLVPGGQPEPQRPAAPLPDIKMVDCDVCGKKVSANIIGILRNGIAQEGINKACEDCVNKADYEFYEPFRAIFARMKEENAWKK